MQPITAQLSSGGRFNRRSRSTTLRVNLRLERKLLGSVAKRRFFYILFYYVYNAAAFSLRLVLSHKKISNFVRTNFFLCRDISVIMEGRVIAQLILP